uniref:Embryo surrounding factor 1 brassicaceae domain-containing protein n=1 Tax=Daucus carota subsp. sativus TaxID=79200 RepID=A0A164V3G0_DAUCS
MVTAKLFRSRLALLCLVFFITLSLHECSRIGVGDEKLNGHKNCLPRVLANGKTMYCCSRKDESLDCWSNPDDCLNNFFKNCII